MVYRLLGTIRSKLFLPEAIKFCDSHSCFAGHPSGAMNSHLSLGYCCLNTRLQKEGIFCSRTCRLPTLKAEGIEFAQNLALQNLKDVLHVLKWNYENDIKVFRLSSDIFPLASHPDCLYSLEFAQDLLSTIGDVARKYGQRLTLHPSQHHVLSAKSEKVLHSSILGLEQQCEVLDRMGMDKQSIMVIHGGGVYGNKAEALERLEKNILSLHKNVRERLVLENDEMAYNLEDLLPISQKLKIPVVVDFHHDAIYRSSMPVEDYLPAVFQVWDDRGIKPKVHVSQSRPDVTVDMSKTQRRAHGDYIDSLPPALLTATRDIDVMFEAKMKEEAVLRYRLIVETGSQLSDVPVQLTSSKDILTVKKGRKTREVSTHVSKEVDSVAEGPNVQDKRKRKSALTSDDVSCEKVSEIAQMGKKRKLVREKSQMGEKHADTYHGKITRAVVAREVLESGNVIGRVTRSKASNAAQRAAGSRTQK